VLATARVPGQLKFEFLDAAQLVKHAFGLVTDGRRKALRPHLHYLFAEPERNGGREISSGARAQHRAEICKFSETVCGAEVTFSACSYREWIASWERAPEEVQLHGQRILATFQP
jgi:hypothetical protein